MVALAVAVKRNSYCFRLNSCKRRNVENSNVFLLLLLTEKQTAFLKSCTTKITFDWSMILFCSAVNKLLISPSLVDTKMISSSAGSQVEVIRNDFRSKMTEYAKAVTCQYICLVTDGMFESIGTVEANEENQQWSTINRGRLQNYELCKWAFIVNRINAAREDGIRCTA